MIDLRSDTLTVPCDDMRRAISAAPVGDDVYGEDPTVNLLQERIADFFGKEAALFVPSGTMSNQISLKILTEPGDEIIADADAHIYYYETAAPAILSNLQIRPIPSDMGAPTPEAIVKTIRPDIYYFPRSRVVCLENTHNRHGGTIQSPGYTTAIKELADKHNLKLHLDGARIWNAIAATDISGDVFANHFDTVSVCLSKGMGAPVGSLIVSSKENIKKALKWRKIFGGGMRQAGLLAAAGLFALDNNLQKLVYDHENAKDFANALTEIDKISVDLSRVQTNMVRFELDKSINPHEFVSECKNRGLMVSWFDEQLIRAVFHLDISKESAKKAVEIVKQVMSYKQCGD